MKKPTKVKKNAHLWTRHPDDYYIENEWVSEALFAKVKFCGWIADPCCGSGRILDAAKRAGYDTMGFDIVERRDVSKRHQFSIDDFFMGTTHYQNIVCNPPYKYDDAFVDLAVRRSQHMTAVLLRAQWTNGADRSRWLESLPLRYVLALTPRPSMPPGPVIEAGEKAGNGTTDFSWLVFERGYTGKPEFGWARRPKIAKL